MSDVHIKKEAILSALCIYLGEDERSLVTEYMDSQRDDFLKDLENITMGICVIKNKGGVLGDYDDIGIIVDRVMIVELIKSVAQTM
ncbi:hypothetical protein cypCar_00033410 [Cyprinus carpio]|nr:hypothetical protein cypCar_00033410 [Cyprinus carpio]